MVDFHLDVWSCCSMKASVVVLVKLACSEGQLLRNAVVILSERTALQVAPKEVLRL